MKYKILQATILINAKQLEEYAEEGWLLITIAKHQSCYYHYFYRMEGII